MRGRYRAIDNTVIAELHEALSNPEKAELYRSLVKVESSAAHDKSHNGEQWTKCAACLADRITGLLP